MAGGDSGWEGSSAWVVFRYAERHKAKRNKPDFRRRKKHRFHSRTSTHA
jgi:hypothetical protein